MVLLNLQYGRIRKMIIMGVTYNNLSRNEFHDIAWSD